jgi:hypothetical protein
MKRKYKSSEEWKMFGFEPTITEVTGKPEAMMTSAPDGHWFPQHILQDFAQAEQDRDMAERMAEYNMNQQTRCREDVVKELRARGFAPANEADEFKLASERTGDGRINLQWAWRQEDCRRDPDEILLAVLDGLTQEGNAAWNGDATGIIEQIVRTQYNRAEKAEKKLAELMK